MHLYVYGRILTRLRLTPTTPPIYPIPTRHNVTRNTTHKKQFSSLSYPPPLAPSPFWFLRWFFFFSPGVRIGLFTPDRAFDMVSKAQIAKLREPSIKLVDLVTTEMMNMCKDASAKVNLPKKNTTVVQINPFLRGEGGEESRGGVSCVLPSLSLCTPHTHILHLCCNRYHHTHSLLHFPCPYQTSRNLL